MKKVKTGIALLFAAALLVFFGCENGTTPLPEEEEEEPVLSSDAGLLSISLNGTAGELGNPVPRSEWESGTFSAADMPLSYLVAGTHEALAAATVTATPSDSNAQVLYGLGTASAGPTGWEESGEFELHNNDYVYIVVSAENLQDRNYYKVFVYVRGSDARLDTLTIAGNEGSLVPNASLADVVPQAVRIEYEAQGPLVEAEPADALATLQFAKVPYENIGTFDPATLAWGDTAASSFGEGDRLYVKCTSPDGESALYYGFEIKLRNHITLTLGGRQAASSGIGYDALGIPTTTLLNGEAAITTAEGTSGLVIAASPRTGSGAAVTGYAIAAVNNDNPTFVENGIESGYTSGAITHGQHLWVRVSTKTGEEYYYRIVITVLSNVATLTNITVGGSTVSGSGLGTPQTSTWTGTGNTGSVIVPRAQAAPNPTIIAVTPAQALATVTWAKAADENAEPAGTAFGNAPIAGGLAEGNYLFVKSVSPDGSTTLYYKLNVAGVKNNNAGLAGLTIDGQPGINFTPSEGGTAVNVGAAYRGTLSLTTAQAATGSKVIRAVPADSNATVTAYAIAASTNNAPTLVTSGIENGYTHTAAIADTNHLFIRVQAEDGVTIRFYRLIITVLSNNATLTGITVGGVGASSLGTAQAAPWAGTDNTGTVFVPQAQTAPNSTSVATAAAQTNAVRTWAVAATADTVPAESAFSGTTPIAGGVANGQYLFVKSVSPDGSATLYYKLAVAVKNNVATLTSAAIGTVPVTSLGTGDTVVNVGTGAGLRGGISLTTAQAALTSRVIRAVPTDSNAAVTGYAIAMSSNNTPTFVTTDIEDGYTHGSAITDGQHLFIRVVAENGVTTLYYRIVITVLSDVATLTSVTAGGVAASDLGTPQTAPWSGTDNAGTVNIPPGAAAPNATSVATAATQTNAVRTWAVAANAAAVPADTAFNNTTPIEAGLSAGQYLFVKSVSPDGSATLYYKLAVAVKNNVATLASASIDSAAVETLPTPNAAWASAVAQTKTYATAPATVTLSAVPTAGSNATVHYAASPTGAAPDSGDWSASLSLSSPASGTYIAVRVTAENGTTVNYYRWRLSIGSSETAISSVTIAGKEPASLGNPGANANLNPTVYFYLTSAQVTTGRQIVVESANNISIRVGTATSAYGSITNYAALTKSGSGPYIYTGTIPGNAMTSNTRIVLQITAENAMNVQYYSYRVTTANNAVPGTLSVGGVTKNSSWGTPAGAWNATQLANAGAITLTAAQAADAAISHSSGTNAGTVSYAKTSDTVAAPVFAALPASGVTFANGDYLYIKLEYTTGGNTYRNIYRIPVVVTE
jgi:hypothetical protein